MLDPNSRWGVSCRVTTRPSYSMTGQIKARSSKSYRTNLARKVSLVGRLLSARSSRVWRGIRKHLKIAQTESGNTKRRSRWFHHWLKFFTLFVLLVFVAGLTVIIIFQSVLLPGQQQRVITILPFMESFLIRQRAPGDILPTALPRTPGSISPADLLSGSLGPGSPSSATLVTETPFGTQVH